jgi:hypothetical protein
VRRKSPDLVEKSIDNVEIRGYISISGEKYSTNGNISINESASGWVQDGVWTGKSRSLTGLQGPYLDQALRQA